MNKPFLRNLPFSYYLVIAVFLILMIAIAGLIGISYLSTAKTLQANARAVELQTEDNLATIFRSKEEGLRIYESILNHQMEDSFPPFFTEYERAGADPYRMDLQAVKETIGSDMELYVIDDDATIIATTYLPEQGLRFGDYAPYFVEYLDRIRRSEGFFPDRIVSEESTGAMKKFAYMPTPDHRYILELGLSIEYPSVTMFRYMDQDLIRQVEQSNPYLDGVRVFDTTLRERKNDTSVEIDDPALKSLLTGVLSNRTTLEIADPESGITTRYLFIDLRSDESGSDVSRIIELNYTDLPVRQALASSLTFYLTIGVIALSACALLGFFTVRSLTRPIEKMVQDVNIIASGNLDHPLTPPPGQDLITLEESISAMVERLKSQINQCQASEKRFMDLVELLPQGIYEADPSGRVTFVNAMAFQVVGYTMEDVARGLSMYDVIAPADRARAEAMFQALLRGERTEGTEYMAIRKDGSTFPMLVHSAPDIQDANVVGIRGTFADISRLKQIEAEIRALNSELEQRVSDRTRQLVEVNMNLESFTYSVSHDLRAPLRAISGYSSLLLGDLPDIPVKDRKYLEMVQQNSHKMGQLIDDLLNFSRLGQKSPRKETVATSVLVTDLLREIHSDPSARNVEFIIGPLPPCQADPALVKQVFANLVANAVKFTRTRQHPVVEIGSLERDGKQTFYVRDNGVGFDMRYADKVFGVFQRLHSSDDYEGTGVGLAIVHRIIEKHGGSIRVESEVNAGTTFFFNLG
jgi:PAS domain S-box-containing protein